MSYTVTQLPPINKSDEWGVRFDSPFSLAAEDLCRFYFFSFWLMSNSVPEFEAVHDAIHATDWFITARHVCPGTAAIKKVYEQCCKEFA